MVSRTRQRPAGIGFLLLLLWLLLLLAFFYERKREPARVARPLSLQPESLEPEMRWRFRQLEETK